MSKLTNIIEALLFVSGDAVSVKDIAEKLAVTEKEVLESAKELQKSYTEERGIQLLIFNKKLQFASNKIYSEAVSSVLNPIKERELSKSMLEVAAIIAYKQPVTRLDLESLRGVNSEFAVQNLLKLGVIEVVGRKDAVGKPVLFGTTDEFLKRFQISSLDELPDYDELMEKIALLRTESQSSYLFHKDEYVDEELSQQTIEDIAPTTDTTSVTQVEQPPVSDGGQGVVDEVAVTDGDFDLADIEDEDLPEHLIGEDVKVIK
ncbi:MAG: SMC-Scp complex subunit ScpB [Clostridia bacterium]|nr:SMC-Scp complex subunit ScpB [Clostridia bacterium]